MENFLTDGLTTNNYLQDHEIRIQIHFLTTLFCSLQIWDHSGVKRRPKLSVVSQMSGKYKYLLLFYKISFQFKVLFNFNDYLQVPIGSYSVKITTGDPKMTFGVGLSVNDKFVIEPQILSKNQYFTNSKEVVVMDGYVRVKSKCEQNCSGFWSRINAIEITKGIKYNFKFLLT